MNRDASDFVDELMRFLTEYGNLRKECNEALRGLRHLRWWGCLVCIWRTEWNAKMSSARAARRNARNVMRRMNEIVVEMELRAGIMARHMFNAMLDYERAARETLEATLDGIDHGCGIS